MVSRILMDPEHMVRRTSSCVSRVRGDPSSANQCKRSGRCPEIPRGPLKTVWLFLRDAVASE